MKILCKSNISLSFIFSYKNENRAFVKSKQKHANEIPAKRKKEKDTDAYIQNMLTIAHTTARGINDIKTKRCRWTCYVALNVSNILVSTQQFKWYFLSRSGMVLKILTFFFSIHILNDRSNIIKLIKSFVWKVIKTQIAKF